MAPLARISEFVSSDDIEKKKLFDIVLLVQELVC